MGIAGMILGILAIILVWTPIIGTIAVPLVAVGLPLSILGFLNARMRHTGGGMAIAGMTTNTVAILIWAALYRFIYANLFTALFT